MFENEGGKNDRNDRYVSKFNNLCIVDSFRYPSLVAFKPMKYLNRLIKYFRDNFSCGEAKVERVVKMKDLIDFNFIEDEWEDLPVYNAYLIEKEERDENI